MGSFSISKLQVNHSVDPQLPGVQCCKNEECLAALNFGLFEEKKLDSLISLDVHQALVVDVLSQLHRKSWGCRVLWPLKLCSVQPNRGKIVLNSFHLSCISILMDSPCARLNQKNNLLVWLVKLYQVGLVVHIVHLFLHYTSWLWYLWYQTWFTLIPTYCCSSSKMDIISKVVNLIVNFQGCWSSLSATPDK